MSVQVGSLCYASNVEAASAACAAHATTITVTGTSLVTVSCSGATNGKMQINTLVSPVDGSTPGTAHLVEVAPDFPPCMHAAYVEAATTVGVALGLVWVSIWGVNRLRSMLHWGRGEA